MTIRALFTEHAKIVADQYGPEPEPAIATLPADLLIELLTLIQGQPQEPDTETMQGLLFPDSDLLIDNHSEEVENKLLANTVPYDLYPQGQFPKVIRKLHRQLRDTFQSVIGSPFVFVNTRAWSTNPGAERFGPNSMHCDGFEPGHLKIMVYLSPLNEESGYLMLGDNKVTDQPAGTCVLFQNSDLPHSGVGGTTNLRIAIEVTLMRALIDLPQLWRGHHYGRHLRAPAIAYERASQLLGTEPAFPPPTDAFPEDKLKINIGSGKRDWPDWICFDEIEHKGVTNIVLSETVKFPLESGSVGLAYSSHNFEHLPDNTLFRILWELRRLLALNGVFILKIPDYDWFLEEYRRGNEASIAEKGIEPILYTWKSKGVADTFANRVAMMFCGYWNKQYGDHFSGRIQQNEDAYHGPAVMDSLFIDNLFRNSTPYEIARTMTKIALADPDFGRFNHQNAWSAQEIKNLFNEFGFTLETSDREKIIQEYGQVIPDLKDISDWSAYYLFRQSHV